MEPIMFKQYNKQTKQRTEYLPQSKIFHKNQMIIQLFDPFQLTIFPIEESKRNQRDSFFTIKEA